MNRKNNPLSRFIIQIALLLVFVFLLSGCSAKERIAAFAKEDPINSRAELYQKIEQALKNGKTEFTFQTTELTKEDFDALNSGHDGFYGTVKSYTIRTIELFDLSTVTVSCEISDNYYVENALLRGEDIPEDRVYAQKLMKICKKLLPKITADDASPYRREKRIHDYLVRNVKYGFKKGDEGADSNAYSSYGALVEKTAVCNGYAQAMKLLCDLSGVECQMITGTADGENHAWNLVKLGDSWYHVDTTWDDPSPDDPNRVIYHYFNTDDALMSADHIWDKEHYPKAGSKDYNYFVINDLACKNFKEFQERCEDIFSDDHPDAIQIQVHDYTEKRYSEENLQFLFRLTGANSLNLQTVGKAPCVTLYIRFSY